MNEPCFQCLEQYSLVVPLEITKHLYFIKLINKNKTFNVDKSNLTGDKGGLKEVYPWQPLSNQANLSVLS